MDSAVEIVVGDSVVVYPWCQMISMLDLSVMTLSIQSPRSQKHQVYTKDGVPLRVTSVAQVNIGPPPNEGGTPHERERILRTAAEMFGGLRRSECRNIIQQTLEGHQRSIIGNMNAREVVMDHDSFSGQVLSSATVDLIGLGVWVTSMIIQAVEDVNGYKEALGKGAIAKKVEQARIAEALNVMQGKMKEAEMHRDARVKEIQNASAENAATAQFQLREAANLKQTNQRTAIADTADRRKEMEINKTKVTREQQIAKVAKEQEIRVAHGEIKRAKQLLEGDLIKPAAAEVYTIEKAAETKKYQIEREAESEARSHRLAGNAEAQAGLSTGTAEASAMTLKAEAWQKYSRASFLDKIIGQLPTIEAGVSKAIGSCDSITLVSNTSNGSGGGQIGGPKLEGKELERLVDEYLAA